MALKPLPFGAIIAGTQGRVVSFSHIAAAILADADGLFLHGGLIAGVHHEHAKRLAVFSLGPRRSAPRPAFSKFESYQAALSSL